MGCSTIKVEGRVNNQILQILIDSGSTHNFVDFAIAEKLGCVTESISPVRVMVANGNKMICNRTCKGFEWWMQRQLFQADVFLIPLENYHMV